jgi:hypothetical protein
MLVYAINYSTPVKKLKRCGECRLCLGKRRAYLVEGRPWRQGYSHVQKGEREVAKAVTILREFVQDAGDRRSPFQG